MTCLHLHLAFGHTRADIDQASPTWPRCSRVVSALALNLATLAARSMDLSVLRHWAYCMLSQNSGGEDFETSGYISLETPHWPFSPRFSHTTDRASTASRSKLNYSTDWPACYDLGAEDCRRIDQFVTYDLSAQDSHELKDEHSRRRQACPREQTWSRPQKQKLLRLHHQLRQGCYLGRRPRSANQFRQGPPQLRVSLRSSRCLSATTSLHCTRSEGRWRSL